MTNQRFHCGVKNTTGKRYRKRTSVGIFVDRVAVRFFIVVDFTVGDFIVVIF